MSKTQPILICGAGSIGERHISNLRVLGYENLAVYRTLNRPYRTGIPDLPVYTDLAAALESFRPDVAFITNPTSLHLDVALACARHGCHLFIEKPLGHSLEQVDSLNSVLESHGRHAMVGYMLRFHPLFTQLKRWIDEGPDGTIGRPIWARSSWGEHVPDWHPWEDYRDSYSVRNDLGGGPSLTLSHELDLIVWFCGSPTGVAILPNTATPLEVACEHGVDMLISFVNGATANVHLDYYQSPPSRSWELVGTRGRVVIDYAEGTLTRYANVIGQPSGGPDLLSAAAEAISVPSDWQRNDLFLAEVQYFFECICSNIQPEPGLKAAADVVALALGALSNPTVPVTHA
jgi:predicted dehydrogenase